MEAWIGFTIFAALMQTIRTAGQKKLANTLSPMATNLVRYLYGLPFAAAYLMLVMGDNSLGSASTAAFASAINSITHSSFWIYATLASIAQILATYWLIKVFQLRSFAIGTIFAKTEAIQAAVLGVIFFNALLSFAGWLAILLGAFGLLIINIPGRHLKIDADSAKYGMLSGLGFAFTALWLRQASLSLEYTFIQNAAITLMFTVSIQTLICLVYIVIKERPQIALLKRNIPLSWFIGATSAFGSVGWYTAMTYQNAALVRSLGQIELVFAVAISYLFFGEKISIREALGMIAITASLFILVLFI